MDGMSERFVRSSRFPTNACRRREADPVRCPRCGFTPARVIFRTVECGQVGCPGKRWHQEENTGRDDAIRAVGVNVIHLSEAAIKSDVTAAVREAIAAVVGQTSKTRAI